MVSGFIESIEGHIIANKFVVMAKIRHSQHMNDLLISIWIIKERYVTILSAHCMCCKAGLAKSSSHIVTVLFYLKAWTEINGCLSCTQVKCMWLLPTYVKQVRGVVCIFRGVHTVENVLRALKARAAEGSGALFFHFAIIVVAA